MRLNVKLVLYIIRITKILHIIQQPQCENSLINLKNQAHFQVNRTNRILMFGNSSLILYTQSLAKNYIYVL